LRNLCGRLVQHFSKEDFQVFRAFPALPIRPAALALTAALCAASQGLAQTGNFELELNTSADIPEGCRLTFVATNNTDIALTQAAYEVAAFNAEGVVAALLVLEFGALPLGKTRVVQFDIPAMTCEGLSRILVNAQDTCESEAGKHEVCIKALSATSRIQSIPFGL
jgi:hypothetical protein